MKNPTSKQFKKVIANFDKVLPMATKRGHLDMRKGDIPEDKEHICKTPMCHGGFYAVANNIFFSSDYGYYDYEDGAELIAEHLGFVDSWRLRKWAECSPEVWGNEYGNDMFFYIKAFDNVKTLRGIRNHWAKVHNRTCKRAKPIPLV